MKTERPSEIQTVFDIEFCWYMTQATACYTLILRFASPTGRVCGVATHAVRGNAGYGLLHHNLKVCVAHSGRVCGVASHAVDQDACYDLLVFIDE